MVRCTFILIFQEGQEVRVCGFVATFASPGQSIAADGGPERVKPLSILSSKSNGSNCMPKYHCLHVADALSSQLVPKTLPIDISTSNLADIANMTDHIRL